MSAAEPNAAARCWRVLTPGKPTRAGLTLAEAMTWAQYYGPAAKVYEDGSCREVTREEAGFALFLTQAGFAPEKAAEIAASSPARTVAP